MQIKKGDYMADKADIVKQGEQITINRRVKDIAGNRYGRLTAIRNVGFRGHGRHRNALWLCKCDCGNESVKCIRELINGDATSCGCFHKEQTRKGLKPFDGTTIAHLTGNIPKNNTSGCAGVSFDKHTRKWAAYIMLRRKKIHLGRYDNIEDAIHARKKAESKYFGEVIDNYNASLEVMQ